MRRRVDVETLRDELALEAIEAIDGRRRKRVQAIGSLDDVEGLLDTVTDAAKSVLGLDTPPTRAPGTAGSGDLKASEREFYENRTPPPATSAKPKTQAPAGARRWVMQAGEWFYVWRTGDTWFDVAARYLGAGKRHAELWAHQTDAFKAKVRSPVGIYTGALVRMPAEGVTRAQQLGELAGGAVAPTPAPPAKPSGGEAPKEAPKPAPAAEPPARPSAEAPAKPASSEAPAQPSGGGAALATRDEPAAAEDRTLWWVAGGVGVLGVLGALAYAATRPSDDEDEEDAP